MTTATTATTVISGVRKRFGSGDATVVALDGVSFDAGPGDSIAIIGRNGAGKSTLLQMIAGVLAPTSGSITRPERVASMLELGSGFHPDLTGSENLEIGMALAGYSSRATLIKRKDIIEFSGLGQAMAKQVKHYSDGMKARLACSIAVHTRPDLLIVDEVLAVGDASFQRQVLTRIHDLLDDGATLLLVTHSVELARTTERTIWLDRGAVVRDGDTPTVLDEYEFTSSAGRRYAATPVARIERAQACPSHIEPGAGFMISAVVRRLTAGTPLTARVDLRPIRGEEPWMRKIDELPEHRNLNLVATTRPQLFNAVEPGRYELDLNIEALPFAPTLLEATLVLTDGEGVIHDELGTEIAIGDSPGRPSYVMVMSEVGLGDLAGPSTAVP